MAQVAALLLAAGESSRMGDFKALLPWRDKTLIQDQVAALTGCGASPIVAVVGYQGEAIESLIRGARGVWCTRNPDYRQGKTTSIKAGLQVLRQLLESAKGNYVAKAILILNVDQPRSPETLSRIVDLHFHAGAGRQAGSPTLITIPTHQGKGGHPIVLSTSLLAELMDISEETLGLRAVVRRHQKDTQRVEIASREVLIDLNTPQDYQEALSVSGD